VKSSFRKFAVLTSGMLTGFFLLLLVGGWWLGGFKSVDVGLKERGPYTIVYLTNPGAYKNLAGTILRVADQMADRADALGTPCSIKYDDPSKVPEDQLRGSGGYVLRREVEVAAPLRIERMPKREVLVGRLEGHPSLAPIKVYPRMATWMQEHGMEADGPALELYYDDAVECHIPVRPVKPAPEAPTTGPAAAL